MKALMHQLEGIEIIDFHTHPFADLKSNICSYPQYMKNEAEQIREDMRDFGVSRIAGSVIIKGDTSSFDIVREANRTALSLAAESDGFYLPGIHVSPLFYEESLEELKMAAEAGCRLVGELVPYTHGWCGYDNELFHALIDEAERLSMSISFHNMAEDSIVAMCKAHPCVEFIAAHPGEKPALLANIERMKQCENLSLDISGTGVFRYKSLTHLINEMGSERIIFGTDYPICNPGVYIGAVLAERLPKKDLENLMCRNAKRIFGIK